MNVPELKQLAEEVRWQAQPVRNRYRYGTDMAPIWHPSVCSDQLILPRMAIGSEIDRFSMQYLSLVDIWAQTSRRLRSTD